jgi:hypothetical protein
MARPTEIEKMVKRSLEHYEFRRRDNSTAGELIRIGRSGRVDILTDGYWRQTTRYRRAGATDGWGEVEPGDLRHQVRRFFLPDLDGKAVVRKPWEWRRRFRDTRLWHSLQPPLKGGSPRKLPSSPIRARCRADYCRELRHVRGDDLAEVKAQIREGFDRNRARIAGAEQRATVFLGASVLTSSLVLGNAGLLLGTSASLDSPFLQIACAFLAVAGGCALVAAYRALQTTMSTFGRLTPSNPKVVFERLDLKGEDLIRDYVAAVFAATNRAATIADWKIARMKSARQWILATMGGVVALTIVVLVDAICGA